jgi:hypothetical protein
MFAMKLVIAFAAIFASVLAGRADQPAPNTLTPAEIAEGWILLFDGKTTFGWNVEGDAKIDQGDLLLGKEKSATVETTSKFGNAILEFDFDFLTGFIDEPFEVVFHVNDMPFRQPDRPAAPWRSGKVSITIEGKADGKSTFHSITEGTGHRRGLSGGVPLMGTGNMKPSPIKFGIQAGHQVRLSNIKLKPLGIVSLFNGKDLTGWHPYTGPDAKSKFSVTPEGTLHIENGKGDLQTDKQWSDFLLQIECRTNAPALNSGVFFRCLPNKYQQGYEAQIQNSFLPAATKEYTIDRYDPKTHKLLAKEKVKFDSYDYGTGAIYRRIPARFKVANDKEWFTMTVLAEGRHMGVWVNGIMVTDWTDNRPDNENGRNGFKAGPGNISLQGHDPTTNLDFRNFRIVDLAPKK